MITRAIALGLVLAGLISGCAPYTDYQVARYFQVDSMTPPRPSEDYTVVAQWIAYDLDIQLSKRLGFDVKGNSRGLQWVVVTVPSDLNNLNTSSQLSRLMAEEIGSQLTQRGYYVEEIRKAADVTFKQDQGEFMLTRKKGELATTHPISTIVITGTYVNSNAGVRFNVRALNAGNNDVLASVSRSVPPSSTVSMLSQSPEQAKLNQPSVETGPQRKTSTNNLRLYNQLDSPN